MVLSLYEYCDYAEMCDKLRSRKPITPWEDIQVGHVYHIPSILNYDRRDFLVTSKNDNKIEGKIINDGISTKNYNYSFFKTEISSRFLVEKIL